MWNSWPELFNREKPKPLKVGITDDNYGYRHQKGWRLAQVHYARQ
ncbi:ProQ/FinO family protein [Escherichia coli]|nr:ProQ/FinO family protein [Escherichia coli]